MLTICFPYKIDWLKSYLSSKKVDANIYDKCSTCAVNNPESRNHPYSGLHCFNDTPQTVDCDLFLHVDDTCLLYQHNDINIKESNSLKKKAISCRRVLAWQDLLNFVTMLSQPYIKLNTSSQKAGNKMPNYIHRDCMQDEYVE